MLFPLQSLSVGFDCPLRLECPTDRQGVRDAETGWKGSSALRWQFFRPVTMRGVLGVTHAMGMRAPVACHRRAAGDHLYTPRLRGASGVQNGGTDMCTQHAYATGTVTRALSATTLEGGLPVDSRTFSLHMNARARSV